GAFVHTRHNNHADHLNPSFFFFSSRRRHTRFSRDWSSDVCSSDLFVYVIAPLGAISCLFIMKGLPRTAWERFGIWLALGVIVYRSEERRVGKECRSRWWPGNQKKKLRASNHRQSQYGTDGERNKSA